MRMRKRKNMRKKRILALILCVLVSMMQVVSLWAKQPDTVSGNDMEKHETEMVSENTVCEQNEYAPVMPEGASAGEGITGEKTDGEEENMVLPPEKMNPVSVVRVSYQSNRILFDSLPNVVGYELYRGCSQDGTDRALLVDLEQNEEQKRSYTDNTDIVVGNTYYYWIRAYVMDSQYDEKAQANKPVRVYGEYSDAAGILARLDRVTGVQASSASYQSNNVTWNAVGGADGYYVYYAAAPQGPFLLAGQATGNLACTFLHQTTVDGAALITGVTYYYKVSAYSLQQQVVVSEDSEVAGATTKLMPAQNVKVTSKDYKSLEISFDQVDGASGYEIYRSTKSNKGFKKIATLKKNNKVSYLDKKCSTGKKYYYKIKAYRKTGAATVYSDFSEQKVGTAVLNTPKMGRTSLASGDTVKLTWKKVNGAQGYQIYRSDAKKGKYKKVQTVKGNVNSTLLGGQENGYTFYYKVRAYRKVSAKNCYSQLSNAKYAVFNIFASANETYTQKAQRIFGKDYYQKYASEAEAKTHMSTFTIQVWDLGADRSTKVSKTKVITVNSNIADTVKQIFKEIYESDEKFPIKNVGGYSWRGDASTSEHCCGLAIDINWEENYMVDNGVTISGKYWKPGEDPYSIPLDCELVRIMEKYGFTRGIWGNRMDYMHFSFFGT